MGRKWSILMCLHAAGTPQSVSDIAKKLGMHISNVSRDLDELVGLEPKIVQFVEQRKDEGGRPFKLHSLTDEGRTIIEVVIHATERRTTGELRETVREDVVFLIKQITSPRNSETQQAAWLELGMLAKRTKLWKQKEVWKLLDSSILTENATRQFRDILGLLQAMLYNARLESGPQNDVATKARQAYRKKLEDILGSTENQWRDARFDVMTILDYIETEKEKFEACWKAWENGLTIKEQEMYTLYLQPFMSYLTSADPKLKKSVRERLYELMQASEPKVREQALAMHHYLFTS